MLVPRRDEESDDGSAHVVGVGWCAFSESVNPCGSMQGLMRCGEFSSLSRSGRDGIMVSHELAGMVERDGKSVIASRFRFNGRRVLGWVERTFIESSPNRSSSGERGSCCSRRVIVSCWSRTHTEPESPSPRSYAVWRLA